jgi:EAL domain-containing protein (putative c-di-GMP-specific phosphodiesterase class I)
MEHGKPISATDNPLVDFDAVCQKLRAAVEPARAHAVSLHDEHGDVLWLSESSMGPDEHNAVREAVEAFSNPGGSPVIVFDLGDSRSAVLLRAVNGRRAMVGVIMIVLDARVVKQDARGVLKVMTPKLQRALADFSAMRPNTAPLPAAPTGETPARAAAALSLVDEARPPPVSAARMAPPAKAAAPAPSAPASSARASSAPASAAPASSARASSAPISAAPASSVRAPSALASAARAPSAPASAAPASSARAPSAPTSATPASSVRAFSAPAPAAPASSARASSAPAAQVLSSAPVSSPSGAAPRPAPPVIPTVGIPAGIPGSPPRPPPAGVTPEIDRLNAALRRSPIALHVQRLVPLTKGSQLKRYEVLLRSKSDTAPNAAPQAMLKSAVDSGLGSMIDRRVITELISYLLHHPEIWKSSAVMFSVNLTTTALHDEHFIKFVGLCLAKSSLPRGMIAFEVDTATAAKLAGKMAEVGAALHRLGCPLVLDDFAMTTECFALLRLPGVHYVKLASEITARMRTDKLAQAAITAVVQMARVLGMHTVAKRTETAAEHEWLTALGVDFVQSNSMSPPMAIESLSKTLNPARD